jgi:hypothetical protein
VHRRPLLTVLERLVWLVAVAAALLLLGDGLARNVYFENTPGALRAAEAGVRMVWAAAAVLVVVVALAWWRGAPGWCWGPVLTAPVVCGGLMAVWSDSLFPQLAYLVVGPLAGLGALLGAVVRWRPRDPADPAPRPAR